MPETHVNPEDPNGDPVSISSSATRKRMKNLKAERDSLRLELTAALNREAGACSRALYAELNLDKFDKRIRTLESATAYLSALEESHTELLIKVENYEMTLRRTAGEKAVMGVQVDTLREQLRKKRGMEPRTSYGLAKAEMESPISTGSSAVPIRKVRET